MSDKMKKKLGFLAILALATTVFAISDKVFAEELAKPAAPAAWHNCGYISCTVYFNQSETDRLASATIAVTVIASACTAAGTPLTGLACLYFSAWIVIWAQSARSQGKCLKVKYWLSNGLGAEGSSFTCGTMPWIPTAPGLGGGGFGAR